MKKILCILFLILFINIPISYSKDYYLLGIEEYNNKNYTNAARNFEYAIKINPQNMNARYYLAQVYIHLKLISDAKEQYNKIIMLAPDTNAAQLAQRGLFLIRQAELGKVTTGVQKFLNGTNEYEDNYLVYVLANGKIRKWKTMPISVYIEPKKHKDLVKKAFEQWQAATQGLIKFVYSSNSNSQITVKFKDKLEASSGEESYVAGYSKPYYKNGYFTKSEINILTKNPADNSMLPDDFIYFSTLHEIGHSLGFNGHSPNSADVMFSSSTEPKDKLTKRDINTMKLLYTIGDTQVSNFQTSEKDVKLQQLQDYVKQFPNKTVGWTNLADYYAGQGLYREAILNYNKAISIDSKRAEPYNLLGATYAKMGDKQNAYNYLKKACDLDKTNEFYLYQFIKACVTAEQKNTGNKYLRDFITANPEKSNTEIIRNLLNK